jgi:kynureninase
MATDFTQTRKQFLIPDGTIYLDGNSLGPLPIAAVDRVERMLREEWGKLLIRGWNTAGWYHSPRGIGDRVGRLIGAAAGSVVMGDTLSIKIFQALAAATALRPDRRVILSDSGNFPSDLYIAEGLIDALGKGHTLKIVEPESVESALNSTVAVMMLTEVDYRTGRLHDMARLTEQAHRHGVIAVWDLAHSAGALPVDVTGCGADFAAGCTYKYLNGGPGAPAFIYIAPKWSEQAKPILSGWMGHEAPFAFDQSYRPAPGIERMRVGTPPIMALAALSAALDVWETVDMADIRRRSQELTDLFITLAEGQCPQVSLASPRDRNQRGSQVSLRHSHAYAVMRSLIARGVIGDFRAPDTMRFGFAPLYNDEHDVRSAVSILADVLTNRLWDKPEFRTQDAVT